MDFDKRYKNLNDAQRQAVDAINGPLMVIAGPGTGKTELLSMRAANILRKTDVLAENILCLTFTESGSVAMRKRLTDIIGRDAYNISVYTFHAFGSEIMSRYREYFYNGAEFRPTDELTKHRIITEILNTLEYNNPLRSTMNGQYTAIKDILSAISDLKRAGLTDSEFVSLLDSIDEVIESVGPALSEAFGERISKTTVDKLALVLEKLSRTEEPQPLSSVAKLSQVLTSSIEHVLSQAAQHPKTTPPLTAWKKDWMVVDADKRQILKAQKYQPKLRALAYVYAKYLSIMQKAELLDFDDMIMQVVHAIEVHDELRYDLQEKYQYIMVDEFQDTNMAQMRILQNLTNNPVMEDTPNIMVVGDDDQAIYGFQGAEVGNILHFSEIYPRSSLLSLVENYRSAPAILESSREVIVQGGERLEYRIPTLDKTLQPHKGSEGSSAQLLAFATASEQRAWIATSISRQIAAGTPGSDIAVIARTHSDLSAMVGYLSEQGVAVSYDKRDNVLEDEVILQLELLASIVHAVYENRLDEANASLPELLSHPAWGISASTMWKISLEAYKKGHLWLEVLHLHDETRPFVEWLVRAAQASTHRPLERMLDLLLGDGEVDELFMSPLKGYFFSESRLATAPEIYISHLHNLTAIRTKLREYEPDIDKPLLETFLKFIQANKDTDTRITSLRHIGDDQTAVRLLSAHGSKGLEFDTVYIVNATESTWGEKASSRTSSLVFPPNLRLRQNNNTYDERLRLFYVAMTRAKRALTVTYSHENDTGRQLLHAGFLVGSPLKTGEMDGEYSHTSVLEAAKQQWYEPVLSLPSVDKRQFLTDVLDKYALSATHVNNFVDVTRGGPQYFLLNNLLHFPSSINPAASYGTAIHRALQRAHDHLRSSGSRQPEEDVLQEFERALDSAPLSEEERTDYGQKGSDALRVFLAARYDEFSPFDQAELNFRQQNVFLDQVHLTGKLDVVRFDEDTKEAVVIDYKTGTALTSWDKGADYAKIKAHKYRQQLLFYKLLIENSRDWHTYTVASGLLRFIEPLPNAEIVDLALEQVSDEEMTRFKALLEVIWNRIQALEFADTSGYDKSITGIRQFEDDLIAGLI